MNRRIWGLKIKRNLKKFPSHHHIVEVLNTVNNVLILCFSKNDLIMEFSRRMQVLYPQAEISTWVYSDLGEKMRRKKNGVRENIAQELRIREYDIIIDLADFVEYPWLLFVSSLPAKIKITMSKEDIFSIYSMILNVQGEDKKKFDLLYDYLEKMSERLPE